MSIAMDGSDTSSGCTCQIGLTASQLAFLTSELQKWQKRRESLHPDEYIKGFQEGLRLALANIYQLTKPRIVEVDE